MCLKTIFAVVVLLVVVWLFMEFFPCTVISVVDSASSYIKKIIHLIDLLTVINQYINEKKPIYYPLGSKLYINIYNKC